MRTGLLETLRRRTPSIRRYGRFLLTGSASPGLRQCIADLSLKRGFVVTTGEERRSASWGIEILPWEALARGEVNIG